MRQLATSGSPYEDSIGFARACRIGTHIAVSGTAPIAADGSIAGIDDLYQQTKRCLEIAQGAIEKLGGTMNDVIRTRIMLTDIQRWEEAAKAHGEIFSKIKPACTFVEVSALINPQWLVELEVDCIVSE